MLGIEVIIFIGITLLILGGSLLFVLKDVYDGILNEVKK